MFAAVALCFALNTCGNTPLLSLGFSHGIPESSCHKIFHKMRPLLTDVIELKNLEKLKAVVQSEMI